MKPHDIIKSLSDAFVRKTRANGDSYTCLVDSHDPWMQDIVRQAHADMMPDDTRYTMIREVVDALFNLGPDAWEDDADGVRDACHETCDALVDVYYSALTWWLHSHIDRVAYVSQAAQEYGPPGAEVMKQIALGQFEEYAEIYGLVVDAVLALAEETSEDNHGTVV